MKRVNPLDAAFLYVESYRTPMHVGCLQVFSPPEDAEPGYVQDLVHDLRLASKFAPPFSLKLKPTPLPLKGVLPAWVEDNDLDINHHLQQWALPYPGGQRELGTLISRLHGLELDMERPLWECHFIEGLEGGRFALFTKMHHALIDGIGGVRLLQAMLSTDPSLCNMPAPWEPHPGTGQPDHLEPTHHHDQGMLNLLLRQAWVQARTLPGLYGAFSGLAKAALGKRQSSLKTPFAAPRTRLNGRISTERRFATQQLPLPRIKEIAQRAGVTVNDVFLELCSSALRKYLREISFVPEKPMIAGLPMSLRAKGNMDMGIQVTFILASLATDIDNPRKRLEAIHASTTAAKQNVQQLEHAAFTEYTLILMMPYILQLVTGMSGRGRPIFNVVISNVPGPSRTLYFNGARLEAMYPLSIVTHGQGMNITVMSYQDTLNIGYTACNKTAPHIQRLAVYTLEALEELESCYRPKLVRNKGGRGRRDVA